MSDIRQAVRELDLPQPSNNNIVGYTSKLRRPARIEDLLNATSEHSASVPRRLLIYADYVDISHRYGVLGEYAQISIEHPQELDSASSCVVTSTTCAVYPGRQGEPGSAPQNSLPYAYEEYNGSIREALEEDFV